MGFAGGNTADEDEQQRKNDWYENREEHVTLCGGYQGVTLYLTSNGAWTKTLVCGVLRLVQVKEIEGYPVVLIQITGVDVADIERGNTFEYELPFNFTFEGELSANLVAIRLQCKPEYLGLHFASAADKNVFAQLLSTISIRLSMSAAELRDFQTEISSKQ